MTVTLTVEGDVGTVDTRTLLTTQGSVTAPSLVTPRDAKFIKRIVAVAGAEGLADGSAVFYLRLSGSAVQRGEQVIMISAGGRIAVQAGSDAAPATMTPFVLEDVDIEVSGGDTLSIAAEMAGSDLGTAHVGVTLFFA